MQNPELRTIEDKDGICLLDIILFTFAAATERLWHWQLWESRQA